MRKQVLPAGLGFRNKIVTVPGGSQILLIAPSGNFIELFRPTMNTEMLTTNDNKSEKTLVKNE
ncbi:hypothetical protein WG954_16970 [Lacibacter sp. H375]|uniref:hypothetical protein n=1 Tax=Lacibacter sp. H375 TaxID=3133424 RepID=UPI0030C02158